MSELLANSKTSLTGEDVIIRAVQFFTNEKWTAQTQGSRAITFVGKPRVSPFLWLLVLPGLLLGIVPGMLLLIVLARRSARFQNLVVTVTPITSGTEVVITYPKQAKPLVSRFLEVLPPLATLAAAA